MLRSSASFLRPLAALLLAGALLSCGGGGYGGPSGPTGSVTFVPARAAGTKSVAMRSGAGSSGQHFELEVVANGLSNVGSVSFVIGYPANLLQFSGQRQGAFLGSQAILVTTPLPGGFQGLVVVDTRPNGAVGVNGSGTIFTLSFEGLAAGTGPLSFASPEVDDSANHAIAGIDFVDGTVTVVR